MSADFLKPNQNLSDRERAATVQKLLADPKGKELAKHIRWGVGGPTIAEIGRM